MSCNCGTSGYIQGGDNAFWGVNMNSDGFMGFVDRVWILLNRIFIVLLIVMIILFIVLAIVGWTPFKEFINPDFDRRHRRRYNGSDN